ncbi:MAG: hypothetical protein ORN56_07750 [Chitinophagales bacterium]|nr:hypothetical protein [Chitinophagales bacterium]
MKRISLNFFFLIIIAFLGQKSFAQGNLQFNQVLTYSGALSIPNYGTSITSVQWTVPTSKVWKIEAKTRCAGPLTLLINGIHYSDYYPNGSGSYATAVIDPSVIWLKAGDIISYEYAFPCRSANGCGAEYFISILEFNIVP